MQIALAFRILVAACALHAGVAAGADQVFENGFEDCGASTTRVCYSGPAGTEGVGICQAGTQQCQSGAWGPCTTEMTPVFESCNGTDDDCDVAIDNGLGNITCGTGACQQTATACAGGTLGTCTPGSPSTEACDGIDNDCDGAVDEDACNCVHVAPTGNDNNPGTAVSPKRTIGAAIAAAGSAGLPNVVCVAADAVCSAGANYDEAVTMRSGVHVYGGYQPIGTTWPRVASCITRIRAQDQRGVYFDASVTAATILDGFTITAGNVAVNAAVTVEGSTGAVVNKNIITGGAGTTSYGVNVIGSGGTAATPTLSNNAITGGSGSAMSVGVRSLNSVPILKQNCDTFDASGRCIVSCSAIAAARYIRARATGGTGAESYGVFLQDSPGAVVDRSSICSNGTSTTNAAGVRLSGDATGTVIRASNIAGHNGQQNAVGIWADPCAGASPWIVNNHSIAARSPTVGARSDGIRALGNCHVRIDQNLRIVGGEESANADANGVFCAKDPASGVASRCTILGNVAILGSSAGFPPTATGIRCDDGACASILSNAQISGRGGQITAGVILGRTGTFVEGNLIQAGCALASGIGLQALDSFARIQNNRIEGTAATGCAPSTPTSTAVLLALGAGLNEVDLHSNDLIGRIGAATCTSRGLAFDLAGAPPGGGRGLIRNNIVSAGDCNANVAVAELNAGADPRVLQNNDLWSAVLPTVLYRDEAASDLTTIAAVNALGDATVSGHISADPLYTGANKLPANSPCRDAGIATAAPPFDFEGDSRPEGPACDIGRDEFTP